MRSLLLAVTLAVPSQSQSSHAAEVDPDAHPLRVSLGTSAGSTSTKTDSGGVEGG